jgi:glucosamine-phosphate N-acetyltransferase
MNIRKLRREDYKQYVELMNDFRPINMEISKEKFNELYDIIFKNSIIFVIEIEQKIIAATTLIIDQKFIHNLAKYGHIEDVIVDSKYRKQGFGKKIINHVVNYCKTHNFYKITLTCNEKLIHFYEKNDFEVYQIHMSQLL